jgi:hypothetical protein
MRNRLKKNFGNFFLYTTGKVGTSKDCSIWKK